MAWGEGLSDMAKCLALSGLRMLGALTLLEPTYGQHCSERA